MKNTLNQYRAYQCQIVMNALLIISCFSLSNFSIAQSTKQSATRPQLRICTGSPQGHYYRVGQLIARALAGHLDVELIPTRGSWENLGRIHQPNASCDAMIGQDDAHVIYLYENQGQAGVIERVAPLFTEHIYLLCNRDVKAKHIRDLNPLTQLMVGNYGSGTFITWGLLGRLNRQYARVQTKELGGDEALLKIIDGVHAQCLLSVSAPAQGIIARAHDESGARLKLINLHGPEFQRLIGPEGFKRILYQKVDVHKNVYPLLLTDHLQTQSVQSVFFIRADWKLHFPKQAATLINIIRQEREMIEQSIY